MYSVIGFIIALAVGMTGIGGGSFTVPALVLIAGLTSGEAVGTAFLFAGVLRLIAAPFYLAGKEIHSKYLWLLLKGAVPGFLIGIVILRLLNRNAGSPLVIILLGSHSDGIVQCDVYSTNTEPGVCEKKFPLASLARVAHRR